MKRPSLIKKAGTTATRVLNVFDLATELVEMEFQSMVEDRRHERLLEKKEREKELAEKLQPFSLLTLEQLPLWWLALLTLLFLLHAGIIYNLVDQFYLH